MTHQNEDSTAAAHPRAANHLRGAALTDIIASLFCSLLRESSAGCQEPIGMLTRDGADLPKRTELVPAVPTFDDLAAGDSDHDDPGDVDAMSGRGDAQSLA